MSGIDDAILAAAKQVWESGRNDYDLPWDQLQPGGIADACEDLRPVIEAAAPHIAAQALMDAADDTVRAGLPAPFRVGEWLRTRARNLS